MLTLAFNASRSANVRLSAKTLAPHLARARLTSCPIPGELEQKTLVKKDSQNQ